MLWHDTLPALANTSVDGVKGKARIDLVQGREAAQHLIRSLFPADEDIHGKP